MAESEDTQLQIKKAARRRLVGAIALTLFVVVVFPLVMDRDPAPMVQDIEVRIPGQADKLPKLATPSPEDSPPSNTAATSNSAPSSADKPALGNDNTPTPTVTEKVADKSPEAVAPKLTEKATEKPPEKSAKPTEKPVEKASGQYIILIGAFNNEGNVKHLRKKLDEIGVKSFTEPFGDKTRVRAGPFPSKDAAEKALQKMKTIQISGQVAPKP